MTLSLAVLELVVRLAVLVVLKTEVGTVELRQRILREILSRCSIRIDSGMQVDWKRYLSMVGSGMIVHSSLESCSKYDFC